MITGTISDRRVFIDGIELLPTKSQTCYNHSPDGFNWGYGGSGPSQLALAIMLQYLPNSDALRLYMQFKWDVVACLDGDFELPISTVKEWIKKNRG